MDIDTRTLSYDLDRVERFENTTFSYSLINGGLCRNAHWK